MIDNPFDRTIVGDIVASDVRAAKVFERFGIDSCCGSYRSIAEACRAAAADPEAVEQALGELQPGVEDDGTMASWPLPRLIDYIVEQQHGPASTAASRIANGLAQIVMVHRREHPEVVRIAASFERLASDVRQHMMKEEVVLFPYIREPATAAGEVAHPSPFGTIENPIRMMEREHREAEEHLRRLRELTGGFTAPPDACANHRACFADLMVFAREFSRNVYLENHVLFPRALQLEQDAWSS
jgi:regulator of cell morphogenesis and NO signaling